MDLRGIFKGTGLDSILIINGGETAIDKSFFYFSGAEDGLFEGSALNVTPDGITMFVYELEKQSAAKTGHKIEVASSYAQMKELIGKQLNNKKKIGLNFSCLPVSIFNDLKASGSSAEFVDATETIGNARMIKSAEELKKLREAARISSEIYEGVISKLREGMTETQVATELVYGMMNAGASEPSFSSIVCFGENASIPHYSPGKRKLKHGDFVLTDYGALYNRYCADTTRTAVFGRASEEQKDMYHTVYEAQKKSLSLIRNGANGKDVNAKAYEVIDSTKYRGRLMHGIGHGIGLEVHDHHALGSGDFTLRTNMAITDEPGIYIPGFGGVRIEDDLIVKDDGYELITAKPPADLIEIS